MNEIEEKAKLISNWIDGKPQSPYILEMGMGDGCNQNCKFCGEYNKDHTNINKMSNERFYSIIKETADLGVKSIMLSGEGDPLFNKNKFLKIVNLVKKCNMFGCLNTNGSLFTEKIIKKLVEIGWDSVNVSIGGPDAETHDYLVEKPGSFEKAIKSIRVFNKYKRIFKKDKPEIFIVTVLNNKNHDKIDKMIELASSLDAELCITRLIIYHNEGKKLTLSKRQELFLRKNLKKHAKYAKEKSVNVTLLSEIISSVPKKENSENKVKDFLHMKKNKNEHLSVPCYCPWTKISINSSGEVGPSGMCYSTVSVKNQKIKDVWFGNCFNTIRENVLNNKLMKNCNSCCEIADTIQIREELIKRFR